MCHKGINRNRICFNVSNKVIPLQGLLQFSNHKKIKINFQDFQGVQKSSQNLPKIYNRSQKYFPSIYPKKDGKKNRLKEGGRD